MQLGFVVEADAAPHDDRRLWPDLVDRHPAAACFKGTLSPSTLATCLELARFLEMPPASVPPVAARLEKMRIPKILPSVIASLTPAPGGA